jgi:hypothetical protein
MKPGKQVTMTSEQARQVLTYLETGDHNDALAAAWPGGTTLERMRNARAARRAALCSEIRKRGRGRSARWHAASGDIQGLIRERVGPMVRGLFPRSEQDVVLGFVARSVVVVTGANVERVLRETTWDHTAWSLANLHLGSMGAPLLASNAPQVVGLCEDRRCYLSGKYFQDDDPLADYLVHEAAHLFHTCKRRVVGLREKRGSEWLLPIAYGMRETFAYACEAYAAVCKGDPESRERAARLQLLEKQPPPGHRSVEPEVFLEIVREACALRNGWKRLIARCALPSERHGATSSSRSAGA